MLKLKTLSPLAFFLIAISANSAEAQNVNFNNTLSQTFEVETIIDGLFQPYGIVFDDNNNLGVTIPESLLELDLQGNVSTISSSIAPGSPSDVLFDGQDFIVAENSTGNILSITNTGAVTTLATNVGDIIGLGIQDDQLIAVDFDLGPEVGNTSGRLQQISNDGTVSTIASMGLGGPAEVVIKNDNFWVTDFSLGRLLRVSFNGDVTEIANNLGQPLDIEIDGEDFIVTDFADGFTNPGNGRILRVSQSGDVETLISGIGNPSGITIRDSDVFFTDTVSGRVARIDNLLNPTSVPESSSVLGLLIVSSFALSKVFKAKE